MGKGSHAGVPFDQVISALRLAEHGFGVLQIRQRLDKLGVVGALEQFRQVGLGRGEGGLCGDNVLRPRAFGYLG